MRPDVQPDKTPLTRLGIQLEFPRWLAFRTGLGADDVGVVASAQSMRLAEFPLPTPFLYSWTGTNDRD